MRQTKKGNQWFFGRNAHIGVDERTGLAHSVVTTGANVADVTQAAGLLHGKEKTIFGDAGYIGAFRYVPECKHQWHIAAKRGSVKVIKDEVLRELTERIEHIKVFIRAAVEHPFRVIKRQFCYAKVRYRGLAKNGAQMQTLFALGTLWMARKRLLQTG